MESLTLRMNTLDSTACFEMRHRFKAIGIELSDADLEKRTLEYLGVITENVRNGVQYFVAKELAWEQIT